MADSGNRNNRPSGPNLTYNENSHREWIQRLHSSVPNQCYDGLVRRLLAIQPKIGADLTVVKNLEPFLSTSLKLFLDRVYQYDGTWKYVNFGVQKETIEISWTIFRKLPPIVEQILWERGGQWWEYALTLRARNVRS